MVLGEAMILLWGGGLLLLGLFGFFAVLLSGLARLCRVFMRAVLPGCCDTQVRTSDPRGATHVVCPEQRCGHVNRADARYCAQCGRRIKAVG